MEIILFAIWLAVMIVSGAKVYAARQSLKKIRKGQRELHMKH